MNLLLSIASNVNRILSRSGLSFLDGIREEIERLGVKTAVVVSVLGSQSASYSDGVDARKTIELAAECMDLGLIIEKENCTTIPIIAESKVYGALVIFSKLDDETIKTLKSLQEMSVLQQETQRWRNLEGLPSG